MALLTIGDTIRLTGVSRAQLYRYLKAGRISRTPDGFLDTAELLRAGLMLRLPDETPSVSMTQDETSPVSSDVSSVSLHAQGDRTILTRPLILSHSAFSAASTTTPHERRRAQVRAPKPVWVSMPCCWKRRLSFRTVSGWVCVS